MKDPKSADVVIRDVKVSDGEVLMTFKDLNDSGLFGVIVDAMVQSFREIPGAVNCAEWRLWHEPSGEHFSLIVQRAKGKTPLQLHSESTAALSAERTISDFWEAEAERLRTRSPMTIQVWHALHRMTR